MARPQLEDGYLSIANEIAEAFARVQLSGNEWRLLWVIFRQTYGWGRKTDRISVTQFEQKTGLKRRHISRAMKNLIDRKIVTKNDATFITTYGLQKDFSKWQLSPKKTYAQNGDATVTKNGDAVITNFGAHKRKKTNKETIPDVSSLKSRYPDQGLIDKAFDAIGSTRRNGKVAESVLLAQLQKWNRYSVEQVEAGIRIYLEKDCAGQGKRENYLLGIIRQQKQPMPAVSPEPGPRKKQPSLEELLND